MGSWFKTKKKKIPEIIKFYLNKFLRALSQGGLRNGLSIEKKKTQELSWTNK